MLTVSETHGGSGHHGAQSIWRWDERCRPDPVIHLNVWFRQFQP